MLQQPVWVLYRFHLPLVGCARNTHIDAESYKEALRWAREIDAREPVKRGRMVNRHRGELHEQLHERHDATDFINKTQDKLLGAE